MLIEEKHRVAHSPNLVADNGSEEDVKAFQVTSPSLNTDIWHKMEEKITEIIQTIEQMRENFASPLQLAAENVMWKVDEVSEGSI